MTQTEHKDVFSASRETKFKPFALLETQSSRQNAFNGLKKVDFALYFLIKLLIPALKTPSNILFTNRLLQSQLSEINPNPANPKFAVTASL